MKKRLIAEQWDTYLKLLPADASATQLIETKRAFYAGANGLFVSILNILEPGAEATDNDLAVMDDIHAEFNEFADFIKAGKA